MAAPNTAYRAYSLFLRDTSNVSIEHLLAILQVDKATHLARFYLDELIAVQGQTGSIGVAGVINPGSDNYQMHNTARHGAGRSQTNGIILNDAGLNTLGEATLVDWVTVYANRVKAQVRSKSAFYVNTDQLGFRYKKTVGGSWSGNIWFGGTFQSQNTEITPIHQLAAMFDKFSTYDVIFLVQNAEGIYSSPVYNINTLDYVMEQEFYSRSVPCGANEGPSKIVFFPESTKAIMDDLTTDPIISGAKAYSDENMSIELTSGWYYTLEDNYSYYYQPGNGFNQRQYCAPMPNIKVIIDMSVGTDGSWLVQAHKTIDAGFNDEITISGSVFGTQGGNSVGSIPFTVTIPANQTSAINTGWHFVSDPQFAEWAFGTFSSSRPDIVLPASIQGYVYVVFI